MLLIALVLALIVSAGLAIRANRLITAALWLAVSSALLAVAFAVLGAKELAVIELSIGAGLVTVLFVFAISLAGEDAMQAPSLLPKPLAWGLVLVSAALLVGFIVMTPVVEPATAAAEPSFSTMLWEVRGLDVLVQIVLIFSGVIGLLGVLAEERPPLQQPVAKRVLADRDRDLLGLQHASHTALEPEKELT